MLKSQFVLIYLYVYTSMRVCIQYETKQVSKRFELLQLGSVKLEVNLMWWVASVYSKAVRTRSDNRVSGAFAPMIVAICLDVVRAFDVFSDHTTELHIVRHIYVMQGDHIMTSRRRGSQQRNRNWRVCLHLCVTDHDGWRLSPLGAAIVRPDHVRETAAGCRRADCEYT